MDQHHLYPNCTGRDTQKCLVIVTVTETLLSRLLLWAESLQEQVSSSRKKKNLCPRLQPQGAERKRVDVYHNTSSPSREQRDLDRPVYGHTCGK